VKIAGSLERIGDHAKGAARTVIALQDRLPLDIPDALFRLGWACWVSNT
jgi:phosphate uptake regulator